MMKKSTAILILVCLAMILRFGFVSARENGTNQTPVILIPTILPPEEPVLNDDDDASDAYTEPEEENLTEPSETPVPEEETEENNTPVEGIPAEEENSDGPEEPSPDPETSEEMPDQESSVPGDEHNSEDVPADSDGTSENTANNDTDVQTGAGSESGTAEPEPSVADKVDIIPSAEELSADAAAADKTAGVEAGVPERDNETDQSDGSGEPESLHDPDELLRTADTDIFPRKGFTNDFSEAQGYLNEILGNNVIHQYYVLSGKGTDILTSMLPTAGTVRAANKRLDIADGWDDEFHVSYKMQRTENIPAGRGGGCWIKYSNSVMKAPGSESGVILYPGERAYYFAPVSGKTEYTPIADLYSLNQDEELRFDFIRLEGVTYFYANDRFLFSYEDGIPGNLSFSAGSILYANGNRVRCDFDDFTMTYRDNQEKQ